MKLDAPVTELPYVGDKYAKLLLNLDITTLADLLHHYPTRYENYAVISKIDKLQVGETVTVAGKVASFQQRLTRKRGFSIQEAVLDDDSGSLKLIWFNQPFLANSLDKEIKISVAGIVEKGRTGLVMKNPEYELIKGKLVHTGRLVPVYPETRGVSSKWLRSRTALLTGMLDWYGGRYNLLALLEEWLPDFVSRQQSLISLTKALQNIHFPQSKSALQQARKRLGFDELLLVQLQACQRKREWEARGKAKKVQSSKFKVQSFTDKLPFKLTGDQQKVIEEILADLKKTTPMNRLLQGDVGSGKTVVAATAAVLTIKSGYQVAFMAPTQVLADQHGETLTGLLEPLGVKIALLTGATKQSRHYASQKPDLIIGTHALIHKRAKELVDKKRLALVIIDEQHRFGVSQRASLIKQSSNSPHVLSMTATPIPRTIALSVYADLNVSTIAEMPLGRKRIKTWVIPERKRQKAYSWIEKNVELGSQVLVICPLIELSEHDSLKQVRAATVEFELLKRRFSKFEVAILHGRMKATEKTTTLSRMRNNKIDILVSTPVVEVGVDIPGASIMVIEAAERFGLAQLHQLRGRVGRSHVQSYCLLFSSNRNELKRLKAMERVDSGLALARLDLKWRGPGELFSTRQHGYLKMKIADLSDMTAAGNAHRIAVRLFEQIEELPKVKQKLKAKLDKLVAPN